MEKEKAEIASLVERYGRVQSLMKYVNSDTLKESYSKQPKGKAVGVDGITKEQYGENLEENIESLLVRMKKFSYKPYPVRRAYIPKGNGKMRGLGQLFRRDFQRAILAGLQFRNAVGVDVKTQNRALLAKLNGQRKTHITESDDCNFAIREVFHLECF